MSSLGDLDSAQSREVEEQLFATHRLQANRHVPVPLPRQDFWKTVHQLLKKLDSEIQTMMQKGMTGMRLQNLQKRQANIRLIASELARKRLVRRTPSRVLVVLPHGVAHEVDDHGLRVERPSTARQATRGRGAGHD